MTSHPTDKREAARELGYDFALLRLKSDGGGDSVARQSLIEFYQAKFLTALGIPVEPETVDCKQHGWYSESGKACPFWHGTPTTPPAEPRGGMAGDDLTEICNALVQVANDISDEGFKVLAAKVRTQVTVLRRVRDHARAMGMDKYTKAAIAVAEADAEAINAQSCQPRDEAAQVEIERTRLHHYNVRANFLHIRAAIKAGA